jgi:two-component system chemotaxis response regulator CheY
MFSPTTKILIVDDMSTMRKLVGKSLKELGFSNLTEAVDGEDAWLKFSAASKAGTPFHLIISDWNMPKMKGIDLLAKIRGAGSSGSIPFILLTAEAEKDQVAIALKAGVSGYLLKPFTKAQLSDTLKQVSGKKAA